MLTITGESHRLLRFGDFNGNFDRAVIVRSALSLGNDGAEDEARVGSDVIVREPGT